MCNYNVQGFHFKYKYNVQGFLLKYKYNIQGFHCLVVDGQTRCLAKSKGRPHVNVSKDTIVKLRRFYKPHNYRLLFI